MTTTMTRDAAWEVLTDLEARGLAYMSEYQCEGDERQCDENPAGTMILVAPEARDVARAALATLCAEVEDWPHDEPRTCMASEGTPPEYLDSGKGTYLHGFARMSDDD